MMNERIKNLIKKHGLSGVNKPKKTPDHPTKKGIVLAKEGDQVKLIRFGDQNMGHNYSPEARKSFKARHAKNIAKGKMSAAYWADKAFWGGEGADKKMPPKSQKYTRGLKNYQDGGKITYDQWKAKYNLKETPDYNLKRAWELGYTPDKNGHLPSVDNQTLTFLKKKNHSTIQKELDWYNSDKGANFRKKYDLDTSGEYYKYVPVKKYADGGKIPPTYPKKTLPTVDIVSDGSGTQYPYYKNLTNEEKRFFSSNTPIGRAVRAKAQTGKVGQTYNDLSKAAKTTGKTAAEFTGVPGAVRFSRNPSENLKGALSTIEKTIIGASPGVPQGSTPYDSKEVEGFFNTLDAAGLASTGAPLVKTGISGAKALPTVARQAGRYVTTQTPLKNTWKLNPRAFKPNPNNYYRMGEGKSFIDDVLQTNKIRAYNENSYASLRAAGKISGLREDGKIVLKAKAFPEADTYWAKGVPLDGRYASQNYGNYMIEASNEIPFIHAVNQRTKQKGFWDAPDVNYNISHTKGNYVKPRQSYDYNIEGKITPSIGTPLEYNPNLIKLYKQDWLRGYKPIEVPRRPPGSPKEMPKPRYAEGGKVATKSNPELWKRIVASVKAGSKGGDAGEWSARKAQLAVQQYKKSGGSYKGPKKETSLSKWTKQEWTTSSGKPSEGKRRYLPKAAWSALSTAQKAATNKAKAEGNRQGKQFVPQPKSIAQKVKSYR